MLRIVRPLRRPLLLALGGVLTLAVACGEEGADPGEDPSLPPGAVADPRPSSGHAPAGGSLTLGIASTNGAPLCSGDLAADTFRYGLCVCGDLDQAGELRTSSMSSSEGASQEGAGGGVGTNGSYRSAGRADIAGSLVVLGDYQPVGDQQIEAELRVGGDATTVGSTDVGQDAWVVGDLTAIGLDVDGALHLTYEQPAMSWQVSAGETLVEDFALDAPCRCDQEEDLVGLLAQAAEANDNEAADLSPDAFADVVGEDRLVLPGGRFYLTGLQTAGDLVVEVQAPSALFIDGDVRLAGRLQVELVGDEAALDLFITGSLEAAGRLELGSADAPARVRTYVLGDGQLSIAGDLELGGALWAPQATLSAAGVARLDGAVTVGRISNAGTLSVRYDVDLFDADGSCPPEVEPGEEPNPEPEAESDPPADDPPADDPPADDPPADDPPAEDACSTSLDCPDPQLCLDGVCMFLNG